MLWRPSLRLCAKAWQRDSEPALQKPHILFLDRGRAFFNTVTGRVTPQMAAALAGTGLSLFWGDDAHAQPGWCADVLLHETSVSWIRHNLTLTTPKKPWLETREQYAARLRHVVATINGDYDVDGLCGQFPGRLDELIARGGDRLRK